MKTDATEKGLETLIVGDMTAQGLWIAGYPTDYDRGYAIDLHQLRAFVEATQPPLVEALDYRLGLPDWPGLNGIRFLCFRSVGAERSGLAI